MSPVAGGRGRAWQEQQAWPKPWLVAAARQVVSQWRQFTGGGTVAASPDAELIDLGVARLDAALAEIATPAHAIELTSTRGLTGRLLRAATDAQQRGEVSVLTISGKRAALIIPAMPPAEGNGSGE